MICNRGWQSVIRLQYWLVWLNMINMKYDLYDWCLIIMIIMITIWLFNIAMENHHAINR